MQSSSSPPRIGAVMCLAGVTLIILGFFLPMFTQSNPQIPGSAHAVYEWQVVNMDLLNPGLTAVLALLLALPLVSMLVVFATSVALLYRIHAPKLVSLRGVATVLGLAIQFLFDVFVFLFYLIGYARTDIGWGFVVMLIGFIVTGIGAFFRKSHHSQERANPF